MLNLMCEVKQWCVLVKNRIWLNVTQGVNQSFPLFVAAWIKEPTTHSSVDTLLLFGFLPLWTSGVEKRRRKAFFITLLTINKHFVKFSYFQVCRRCGHFFLLHFLLWSVLLWKTASTNRKWFSYLSITIHAPLGKK